MYDLNLRIHKSVSEELKLVFLIEDVSGYIFFVLGKSEFIYRIIINKKFQKCNCEDFLHHKYLCKHILFILFKVIRLYRFIDNKIYLRRNSTDLYKYTDFIKNNKFADLDWNIFKKYYVNLNLKKNYYNINLSNKFQNYYKKYFYMAKKCIEIKEAQCPICLNKTKHSVKCGICKSSFHADCIFTWLQQTITKRCPICRSDYWETIYPYYQLVNNEKIPLDNIINCK